LTGAPAPPIFGPTERRVALAERSSAPGQQNLLPRDEQERNLAFHLDMAMNLATSMMEGDDHAGLVICIQQLQGVREWQKAAGVPPTGR
jgi:hypothetical protein